MRAYLTADAALIEISRRLHAKLKTINRQMSAALSTGSTCTPAVAASHSMSRARFLIVLIVAAALSAASSHAYAGGYYYGDDDYGGYYYGGYHGGYYAPADYEPYYPAAYGYGPAYGAHYYGLVGLLLPFLWGDAWGPPDDYCHQRVRVGDGRGGWVWGYRIAC